MIDYRTLRRIHERYEMFLDIAESAAASDAETGDDYYVGWHEAIKCVRGMLEETQSNELSINNDLNWLSRFIRTIRRRRGADQHE